MKPSLLREVQQAAGRSPRTLLVQSAWSILRTRSNTDPLKRWGDHIAQTRGKKIAAVALARKLSSVLWAMLRDGTFYDSALEAHESARGVREQAMHTARRARVLEYAAKKLRRSAPSADAKAARPPAKTGPTARRARTA
jgi:transposase